VKFQRASTLREQASLLCTEFRDESKGERLSFQKIADFLTIKSGNSIQHQWTQIQNGAKKPGRPSSFSKDPLTLHELQGDLQFIFNINISDDTLRHYLYSLPKVHMVIGKPKDSKRVLVADSDLKQWYLELQTDIKTIPAAFLFNMDETGCCDWVDKKEIHVLVPSSYKEKTIEFPVDRNSKRSTLFACVSADGLAMKPFIIVNRLTLDADLLLAGYTSDVVLFVHQPHSFMTRQLFHKWAEEVFFPTLSMKRLQHNYFQKEILLMDGFGAHYTPQFEEQCTLNNVVIRFLIPHSSDQCQPLDAITFASLKMAYATIRCETYESKFNNQIVRIMRAWSTATTADLVVQTFRTVGISPYIHPENRIVYCRVELEHSLHLKHLCDAKRDPGGNEKPTKKAKREKVDS
jgi:hypothetical protein